MTCAVSVVIPHLDDLDGLDRSLQALAAQSRLPDEIIVADNGSRACPDAVQAVLARHPLLATRLLVAPERGAGPARNVGAAAATGRMLAFLDCDCQPNPDWIVQGLADAASILGGPVVVVWNGPPNPVAAFDLLFGFDVARSLRRHGHVLTANLWVSRAVFQQVGPFRNGVSEDVEWCHRASAAGHRLLHDPLLSVQHQALSTLPALAARWQRITRETWLLRREQGHGRLQWLGYLLAIAASIPVHAMRVLFSPRLSGAGLRLRTLAVLCRIRIARVVQGVRLLVGDMTGAGGR